MNAEQLGQNTAFALAGVPQRQLLKAAATADVLSEAQAGPFHQATCRFVKMAYEQAGRTSDYGYALFTKLAEAPEWDEAYNRFMGPVYSALGRSEGLAKEAGIKDIMLGTLGGNALQSGIKMGPDAFKMLVTAGLLSGSSLGALHWGAKRHIEQDDPETEKIQAKKDVYNDLTGEINDNLLAKGLQ